MELTRKFGYFYDIQHFKMIAEIMTHKRITEYIRFVGILYNFWNTYNKKKYTIQIKLKKAKHIFLLDKASLVI